MSNIKFIGNDQINSALNIADIINVVKKTFSDLKNNKAYSPKKFSLTLPGNSKKYMKWINSMPAYLSTEKVAGVKWVSVCSENSLHKLPTTSGIIILNDMDTGIPLAILDASLITHYRSAASILAAAQLFAPKQSKVLTIIGPGGQGTYSALFLNHQFNLEKINVVSRTNDSYIEFKKKFNLKQKNSPILERKTNIEKCIHESDIVIVSSNAVSHLLNEKCFLKSPKKNQFICGLTAFNDISPAILNILDNIIFDDGENAMKRIEEVSNVNFSELPCKNIYNMILIDSKKADANRCGMSLYLPVGISAMDIAIANDFYKKLINNDDICKL